MVEGTLIGKLCSVMAVVLSFIYKSNNIIIYFEMLPELNKKRSLEAGVESRGSQPRIDSSDKDIKDLRGNPKSVSAKKVRTGGGFMKSNYMQQSQMRSQLPVQKVAPSQNYAKFAKIRRTEDLSSEIKLIEKKIKACQKKIQQDRKKQKQLMEQATKDQTKPDYNFQKVVQRELKMQGYNYAGDDNGNGQNFDYLTNPKINPNEEEVFEPEVVQKPLIQEQKPYDIEAGIQKLQKFYQNSLKKKFQRRQMFPHQACKRKTPKLYITQKTNALNKYGKAQNEAEHLFRVLTKQTTPQQIYPTIPNFAVVKDNLSKNIVAYLGDYKPFLDKTKEGLLKSNSKEIQDGENQESDGGDGDLMGESKGGASKDSRAIEETLKVSAKAKTSQNQKDKVQQAQQ